MKNKSNKLMITCKEASLYIEQKNGRPFTLFENFKLKFHLFICKACANYAKQHAIIDKLLSKYYQKDKNNSTDEENISALKMKIIENFEKK